MPDAAKPKKQAVIVVHGMGEQRPMETLRGIVRAIWSTDTDGELAEKADEAAREARRFWTVPDRRTGSLDLSRITTKANKAGMRTDFFELYWADLFTGNTLQHLSSWLRGLLLRWPLHVPKDVLGAWVLLWGMTILAAGLIAAAMFADGGLIAAVRSIEWKLDPSPPWWKWPLSAVAFLGVFFFMSLRLSAAVLREQEAVNLWNTIAPTNSNWRKGSPDSSRLLLFLVPSALFVFLLFLFPWQMLGGAKFWYLAFAGVIGLILKGFVVPYVGDVARYTQNAPWAIEARARIRSRGLGLLRELHGMNAQGEQLGKEGEYQRIVIVAHSLGSVVAYDLLRYYWVEAGPVGKNPAPAGVISALQKVDEYVKSCSDGNTKSNKTEFQLVKYRSLQKEVIAAMAADSPYWKITDFVTLGSPLTHAEFLISKDRLGFARLVRDLVLPQSPPVLDASRNSFLYSLRHGAKRGQPADTRADHGALFAAVRWTNICDPGRWVLGGDVFSGLLAENFGKGIEDIKVKIRNGTRPFSALTGRLLTHTEYWNAEATGTLHFGRNAEKSAKPAKRAHIKALKDAVNLGEPKLEPPKSRSAPVSAHPAPAGRFRPKSPPADTISPPS